MKSIYFLTIALFFAVGCNKKEEAAEQPFHLTATVAKEKELATADSRIVETDVMLNGKITFNEDKVAKVFPLAGGFVRELFVELGDYVKKGQVLAIIRSPEIAGFTNEGLTAESQLSLAEKNAQVAEDLYKSGDISEVELINARKELANAKSEVERIQAVLDMYGAAKGSVYPIKSPVAGIIVQKNVSLNMELRTEDISPVFVVGSLEDVWVLANVYESDIRNIKTGYDAAITTISYPDKVYRGKIDKIFDLIDAESKVLKARVTLPNPNFELKPEMFAKVTVSYKEPFSRVTVPSRAVIFDKSRYFIMVYKSDTEIETREVKIYKEHNDITYIESGLAAGERVMTKYQLLVYDALND